MKLNASEVDTIVKACLFQAGEKIENAVKVEGVVTGFGFHPRRIEMFRPQIQELLEQLPEKFCEGWSFLNGCMTKEGRQWGEQRDVEALFCLGIGAGLAQWCAPREVWDVLPGGMPYFQVKKEAMQ